MVCGSGSRSTASEFLQSIYSYAKIHFLGFEPRSLARKIKTSNLRLWVFTLKVGLFHVSRMVHIAHAPYCPLYTLGGLAAILQTEREDGLEATQFSQGCHHLVNKVNKEIPIPNVCTLLDSGKLRNCKWCFANYSSCNIPNAVGPPTSGPLSRCRPRDGPSFPYPVYYVAKIKMILKREFLLRDERIMNRWVYYSYVPFCQAYYPKNCPE